MVTACSSSSSMRLLIPGAAAQARQFAWAPVACQRLETIGLPQCGHFGTFHLHGRLHPLPLRLACFRAYASSAPLLEHLQGSIPDPWLAAIWAGLSPAGSCSIAMPQPRLDPFLLLWFQSGTMAGARLRGAPVGATVCVESHHCWVLQEIVRSAKPSVVSRKAVNRKNWTGPVVGIFLSPRVAPSGSRTIPSPRGHFNSKAKKCGTTRL